MLIRTVVAPLLGTNCYLVPDGDRCVVVHPGGGAAEAIRDGLAARGVRLFAAVLQDSISCYDANLTGGVALVIGAEDVGLDDVWRHAAKASGGACVRIPMRDRLVDSLNASNAAAVLLYEAVRQRG